MTFSTMMASSDCFKDISPHDTNPVAKGENGMHIRAVYVGSGGNIKMSDVYGNTVTFYNVPDGTLLPVQPKLVWSSVTSATLMIALY